MPVSRIRKISRRRLIWKRERDAMLKKRGLKDNTRLNWSLCLLTLIMLILLLTGCSTPSQISVSTLSPVPALSPTARQPPRSSVCLPTCIQKASSNIQQWQKKLNDIDSRVNSANNNMTQ